MLIVLIIHVDNTEEEKDLAGNRSTRLTRLRETVDLLLSGFVFKDAPGYFAATLKNAHLRERSMQYIRKTSVKDGKTSTVGILTSMCLYILYTFSSSYCWSIEVCFSILQLSRASKVPYPAINVISLIASASTTDPVLAVVSIVFIFLMIDVVQDDLLVNACLVSNLIFDLTFMEPLQVENL